MDPQIYILDMDQKNIFVQETNIHLWIQVMNIILRIHEEMSKCCNALYYNIRACQFLLFVMVF